MDENEMEDLAFADLDRAHESLYFAARRYCAITDAGFIQGATIVSHQDAPFVNVGNAAADLVEAGQRYAEAYARWEQNTPGEQP